MPKHRDSLAKVLASYVPGRRSTLPQITRRLIVTPDEAMIDTLTGGSGDDWIWTSDGVDVTDLSATEELNEVT